MRSTYALACLFAAMFVMATSSHAETSGGGDRGLLASEIAHTPVSRRATASRTRKVVSARPKLREKTKLTRAAVERKVIRSAQKPAKPRVATARSSAPKLDKTSGVEATERRLVDPAAPPAVSPGPLWTRRDLAPPR